MNEILAFITSYEFRNKLSSVCDKIINKFSSNIIDLGVWYLMRRCKTLFSETFDDCLRLENHIVYFQMYCG